MTAARSILLCALLAASAAGCRHAAPLPISPERTATGLEGRSLADPELREFLAQRLGRVPEPWPSLHWSLDELTLAALFFQPELRVTEAAAEVATAQVARAGQRPNPTLVVQPQRVASPVGAANPWLAIFQLDWTIETAGKRAHRVAAAAARASAAELATATAIWSARGNVHAAVIAQKAAESRLKLRLRTHAVQQAFVTLLDKRLAAGAIAASGVAPQRIALIQMEGDLAASRRRVREARAMLAAVVGVPVAALAGIEIDFSLDVMPGSLAELTSGEARRAALLSRSDVRAMLAEYEAAERDLGLELARQYPNVRIGPGYEFDQGASKWGLALSLDLPLLNQNQGAIEEALARRAWVGARFEALQARVIAEVDSAAESYSGSAAELEAAWSLVGGALRRMSLEERALEMGAADRVALLSAELEVQRATAILIDAQERSLGAIARLEQAVQPSRSFLVRGSGQP